MIEAARWMKAVIVVTCGAGEGRLTATELLAMGVLVAADAASSRAGKAHRLVGRGPLMARSTGELGVVALERERRCIMTKSASRTEG